MYLITDSSRKWFHSARRFQRAYDCVSHCQSVTLLIALGSVTERAACTESLSGRRGPSCSPVFTTIVAMTNSCSNSVMPDALQELTSETKNYAAAYLNETDESRENAVTEIRCWLEKNDDLSVRIGKSDCGPISCWNNARWNSSAEAY